MTLIWRPDWLSSIARGSRFEPKRWHLEEISASGDAATGRRVTVDHGRACGVYSTGYHGGSVEEILPARSPTKLLESRPPHLPQLPLQ